MPTVFPNWMFVYDFKQTMHKVRTTVVAQLDAARLQTQESYAKAREAEKAEAEAIEDFERKWAPKE